MQNFAAGIGGFMDAAPASQVGGLRRLRAFAKCGTTLMREPSGAVAEADSRRPPSSATRDDQQVLGVFCRRSRGAALTLQLGMQAAVSTQFML
mmetsp:Transcript_40980/g.117740  ORF Transcript_40980/g.117740 Transcript_40980/m.117740 type:complete len:93 (+) Transcript_40980:636-914(+)